MNRCPLPATQAPVRLHAYGVGRGVDREELLRIISASDAATAEDRCALLSALLCTLFASMRLKCR